MEEDQNFEVMCNDPDITCIYKKNFVSVPGHRSRGLDLGLERGSLSLVRIIEEKFQENSGSGLENRN
jgi:hypothetical protein